MNLKVDSLANSFLFISMPDRLRIPDFGILDANKRAAESRARTIRNCTNLFKIMGQTVNAAAKTVTPGDPAPHGSTSANAAGIVDPNFASPLSRRHDVQEQVAKLESEVAEHVSKGKSFSRLIPKRDKKREELHTLAKTVLKFSALWDLLQSTTAQPSAPKTGLSQASSSDSASTVSSMDSVRKLEDALQKRTAELADARCKIARSLNDLNSSLADYIHLTHTILAVDKPLAPLSYDDVCQAVRASLKCPSLEEQAVAMQLAQEITTRCKSRKRCRDELEELGVTAAKAEAKMVAESELLVDYEGSRKKARLRRRNTDEWDARIEKQEKAVEALQADLQRIQRELAAHPAVREFPEFVSTSSAPPVSSDVISKFSGDDYELLHQLSVTSFSIVQHVRHKESGAELVLKEVLHARDFEREVRHLQALRHPLILPIEMVFTTGGRMIMQLPYLPLGSLRSWFEKQKVSQTRNLSQIRSVMQQVFQAVSYIHSHGVVHRDLKPENILWIREGRIVLCDFWLSRSVVGGGNVTGFLPTGILGNATHAPGALALTPGYAAPELFSTSEEWKENPWAVDLWSLGIMLVELSTGQIPKEVDEFMAHDPESLHSADPGLSALWELAKGFLRKSPSERTLVNKALSSSFFQQPTMTAASGILSVEKRVTESQNYLLGFRQDARKNPSLWVKSIDAISQLSAPQYLSRWNATLMPNGRPLELSEFIKIFLDQAIEKGLLEQCGEQHVLFRPFLPSGKVKGVKQMEVLGRVLAKAMLEGVPIEIEFSVILFEFLRGDDAVQAFFANQTDVLRAVKAFEPAKGRMLEDILRRDFKQGSTLETVATYLGGVGIQDSIDERPVDNTNKHDLVITMARHLLVDCRIKQLEKIRKGFLSVLPQIETKLAHLSGHEIALFMVGNGFVDRDAVKKLLVFDQDSWESNVSLLTHRMSDEQARNQLFTFLDNVSILGLRSFILRTLGTLSIPAHQPRNVIVLAHQDPQISLPHFDSSGQMIYLPGDSTSYEAFCARMIKTLQLGERDGIVHVRNIDRAEIAAVAGAMRGEIQAGGWYRCGCGSAYAIGECGGAMEEARCPDCGGTIGGQRHRLRDDDRNDLTVDGAAQPLDWNQNAQNVR
jgi:serine/threonine protein kinase/cell division septum initiation protein DivIVA